MCRATMGRRTKSGRGLPHSKTLSRTSKAIMIPPGFGVRQSSAAFALDRLQFPTVLIAPRGGLYPGHLAEDGEHEQAADRSERSHEVEIVAQALVEQAAEKI